MIVTFHSYKGGVGRSLTLAGVAAALAHKGKNVLAVDFDLEAPCLEQYLFDDAGRREALRSPGLIDLVSAYTQALTDVAENRSATFKNWKSYVCRVADVNGGRLDLMTAGARGSFEHPDTYGEAVMRFDARDFLKRLDGEQFLAWLAHQFLDRQTGYDIVLVDSRTGINELAGMAMYSLADVVVSMCSLNRRSIDGTVEVLRDFGCGGGTPPR